MGKKERIWPAAIIGAICSFLSMPIMLVMELRVLECMGKRNLELEKLANLNDQGLAGPLFTGLFIFGAIMGVLNRKNMGTLAIGIWAGIYTAFFVLIATLKLLLSALSW